MTGRDHRVPVQMRRGQYKPAKSVTPQRDPNPARSFRRQAEIDESAYGTERYQKLPPQQPASWIVHPKPASEDFLTRVNTPPEMPGVVVPTTKGPETPWVMPHTVTRPDVQETVEDPSQPTLAQRTVAKRASLIAQIVADNPGIPEDVAHDLAVATLVRHPELVTDTNRRTADWQFSMLGGQVLQTDATNYPYVALVEAQDGQYVAGVGDGPTGNILWTGDAYPDIDDAKNSALAHAAAMKVPTQSATLTAADEDGDEPVDEPVEYNWRIVQSGGTPWGDWFPSREEAQAFLDDLIDHYNTTPGFSNLMPNPATFRVVPVE